MAAQNVPGSSARKRTIGLLALLTLVSSCECEQALAEARCRAGLALSSSIGLNGIYATDEWDVTASFAGDAANCGNIASLGLNWTVSNNLTILQTLNAGVRLRANAPGAAYVNADALAPSDLTARLDWSVLLATGDLNVTATIPDNGDINYRIFGNGFDQSYTTPRLITDLTEGSYNWEAVEVLRGPQGTLYGASPSSGAIDITRNTVSNLALAYELKNVELQVKYNVPAGVPGPFGRITGNGVDFTFAQAEATYGFDPGSYTIENYDIDPQGYRFTPTSRNESLSLTLGVKYVKDYDLTPERGRIIIGTTGAPAGIEDKANLIDPMGGTWDIVLPYTGYVEPGDWQVENRRAVFEDADNDRITYFSPRISGFQLGVTAGQDTEVQYEYDISWLRTDWASTFTIGADPYNHGNHVNMPSTMNIQLWEDQVNPGAIKVKGGLPFAKVIGTIDQNGQVNATGTGDAAGFSDVPFTLTGAVDWTAETFSGELQVGQDTPPTGLPNGSIRYLFTGTRIKF